MSKKALLTGVAFYKDASIPSLPGVERDIAAMSTQLAAMGFTVTGTLLNSAATKSGILGALAQLINSATTGDYLLWYHSGHGTNRVDFTSPERDHVSEIIVSHDHDWDNPLWDREIREQLSKVSGDVRLTAIVDACHSEGFADEKELESIWSPAKFLEPPDDVKAADELTNSIRGGSVSATPTATSVDDLTELRQYAPAAVVSAVDLPPYVQISAARFNQKARMDSFNVGGTPTSMSVFTHFLIEELAANPKGGFADLVHSIALKTNDIWSHVPTLRCRPEFVQSSLSDPTPAKDTPTDRVYFDCDPGLATDARVANLLSRIKKAKLQIIPIRGHEDFVAQDQDVQRWMKIESSDSGGLQFHVVSRSGRVLKSVKLD